MAPVRAGTGVAAARGLDERPRHGLDSPPMTTRDDRAAGWLRWLPSPVALLAIALGGVMFAITVLKGVRDPDLFWHLTTGQLIATTGQVPSTDPFSFTWFGKPWTPHEWLSELLIYWLVTGLGRVGRARRVRALPGRDLRGAGRGAAARERCARAGPGPSLQRRRVRDDRLRHGATPGHQLAAAGRVDLVPARGAAGPSATVPAADPALRAVGQPPRAVRHRPWGGWRSTRSSRWPAARRCPRTRLGARRPWPGSSRHPWSRPAGPIGILYPLRYIEGGDWGLANIAEWQSPDFHEPAHLGLLLMIVLLGLNGGRATPGWLVALSWVGVAMALLALRNAPIAAVFAMPTLVMGLEARLRERDERRNRQPRPMAPSRQLGRRVMELVTALVIALGSMAVLIPRDLDAAMDESLGSRFPVAGVDVARAARAGCQRARRIRLGRLRHLAHARLGRPTSSSTAATTCIRSRCWTTTPPFARPIPAGQQLAARYGVEAILLPPGDDPDPRPRRGRGLVRGLPRQAAGGVPAALPRPRPCADPMTPRLDAGDRRGGSG